MPNPMNNFAGNAMPTRRRALLVAASAIGACALPGHALAGNQPLRFPRDLGSHNDFDIEWWYLTGYLEVPNHHTPIGVQVTFFRKRIDSTQALHQQLAAKHLVFAHAAIAVPPGLAGHTGQLLHSERTARWNGQSARPNDLGVSAYPQAWASEQRMDVGIASPDASPSTISPCHAALDSASTQARENGSRMACGVTVAGTQAVSDTKAAWWMRSTGTHTFDASVHAAGNKAFALQLKANSTQPPILQGNGGLSQKGPNANETSWYTTHAQLQLEAKLVINGHIQQLPGRGWLDHEWSHGFMPQGATGWDWVGFNFDDGSALTAFQLRDTAGQALWRGGSWRSADGLTQSFAPSDVQFEAGSTWQSPRTGVRYPVAWQLRTPQGQFEIRPIMADQELDSRQSTGTIYWEGLCGLYALDGTSAKRVAWGYLEMTGYGQPIQL